ncbi:hypothetical protein ES703_32561 [subsurface metagenome]
MNSLLVQLNSYAKMYGLSKRALASQLAVPYSTLKSWLTLGKSHVEPSSENVVRIQTFLQQKNGTTLNMLEKRQSPAQETVSTVMTTKGGSMRTSDIPKRYKTAIRDPIHGDIDLTPLEIKVIDTVDFQRLRHIKQLGTASLVYPGATHTRFDHSLGTVAASQRMIDAINKNPNTQLQIDQKTTDLIRMCALLHDITHIPFGHSLEDEGFIYPRHDRAGQDSRWNVFLGPSSEIGKKIIEDAGEEFRRKIIDNLTAKGEQINQLDAPFVVDIVGNTVCADLLDYLARDAYYAGLRETYDPRFLKYLLISSDGEYKKRLVLSLYKEERMRRDVVSEVMHLLRLRYSLAEKIYYHHAKVTTTAMLIEAVQAAKISKPLDFDEKALCKLGDDELLFKLQQCGDTVATKLAEKLRLRALYKPVYMLVYSAPSPEDRTRDKKVAITERFRHSPEERFELERRLEEWNRLPEGSVIIYCPTENMNLKEVKTLALWQDERIRMLIEAPGEKLKNEVKSINDAHQELWKMYVFLERGLPGEREKMENLASDCSHEFELRNAIESLSQVGKPSLERYIEEWATEFPNLDVKISEKEPLIKMRSIYAESSTADPPSYEELKKALDDLRKTG